jgi:small-conductance mechanosensitive channel
VGVLLASVLAVLVASDLWRRATLRYVRDPSRRRPILVLRRLVVGLALVLVVAFGLASEVGSLATFMGFLTAGIALSLQNVILSVIAYFFLIGRHGVRVGDRITLAGATGRVIDVSLLRLYLLELSDNDPHSTGRLVVLSNATLFQPTPFYKQIPGARYRWHTVTLTIAFGAPIEVASRRLTDAAAEVFRDYRAAIEQQQQLMQRHVDFDTGLPGPQVSVEVASEGLRCAVRYPVPPEDAEVIDQRMFEALRDAIDRDAELQLLETGGVQLSLED